MSKIITVLAILSLSLFVGCVDNGTAGPDDGSDDGTMTQNGSGSAGSGSATMPDAGTPDSTPTVDACIDYKWMTAKQWSCAGENGFLNASIQSKDGACSVDIAGSGMTAMTQVKVSYNPTTLVIKMSPDWTITCWQTN